MADTLYIVVPCYNEEEVLPVTAEKLKEKTEQLKADGAIFFQESNALRKISGAFSLRVYSSVAARQALNAS